MHKQLYYEAIIQIRPADEKVLDYIEKQISKRKDVFISKIDRLKTGVDLYISSQRFARALGKKLKKVFEGDLKLTRKLYGVSKKTGKTLYRVTVLFRLKEKVL